MPRKKKRMNLPNGYGSITKLTGNRRNPYMVRVNPELTADNNTGKAWYTYKTLGYYPDYETALEALVEYHKNPYDIDADNITFSELYEKWTQEYFETVTNKSSTRSIKAAYNYCKPLYNMRMKDIRVVHLEQTIANADVGSSTKGRIKSVFNLMYRYALKHEIVEKNYAALANPVKRETPKEAVPFTADEIEYCWQQLNKVKDMDMLIIDLYSGWRPQELATLKKSDIDLENMTMKGGMKTEAGKDRIVPIHSRIVPLIKNRMKLFPQVDSLFCDAKGNPMTYDKYRHAFDLLKATANLQHRPHEARHTFISLLDDAGANKISIQKLVGHSGRDITERTYTHKDIDQLRKAIELLK